MNKKWLWIVGGAAVLLYLLSRQQAAAASSQSQNQVANTAAIPLNFGVLDPTTWD